MSSKAKVSEVQKIEAPYRRHIRKTDSQSLESHKVHCAHHEHGATIFLPWRRYIWWLLTQQKKYVYIWYVIDHFLDYKGAH
jgi:hypothetical protein